MLSAKRCGSTAMFKVFQKHPETGVCHIDKDIDNWEPNFWNMGAEAIQGSPKRFVDRFRKSHPFLDIPDTFTEESLFRLWDTILARLGPVVFDKSPQYLGSSHALELMMKYREHGNDVRLFALIRDPRDAITSQYELWNSVVENDSPKRRELLWLEKYNNLEKLQKHAHIPLFRYEDFSCAPSCYAPMLFHHCDCANIPETYKHIRPTSIGRYFESTNPEIRAWKFGKEFTLHLKKYGYDLAERSAPKRAS